MMKTPSSGAAVFHEPRWPAIVALLAVGGIYTALPEYLVMGPGWLVLVAVSALLVPLLISHYIGRDRLNRVLGYIVNGIITIALIFSLFLLIKALPQHKESATELLRSAGLLWITNVVVFSLWYWRLDAGGPHRRDRRDVHAEGSFLFPQMTQYRGDLSSRTRWAPQFIDYLFIAFNTSTAFSPTDTPVLSRWAKILTMIQALISLVIVALLVSRAIGLL
ncbi:MAG TPA: hypothetical protein VMT94_01695 [Burkholderiales bacterium]|nr:hypothetical protein [Burkholderiales bacterium]